VDLHKVSDYISRVTRKDVLESLGFSLSAAPPPAANYRGLVVNGTTVIVSGCLPLEKGVLTYKGKLGADVDLVTGQQAAALCAVNLLRLMNQEFGDLARIKRLLRLGGFVNCTESFTDIHLVLNGASDLMVHVLGESGIHARAAVGVAQLPLGASVEVEALFEVSEG
jgi:enamine deaminase RidA (YjgF/YER057c/UK114 family)